MTNTSPVQFHFVTITPADANARLATIDPRQRTVKTALVDYLYRQILSGDWEENTAEPIKISKSGKVLDGQHRLTAIVKANRPVKCHVAIGLPEEVMAKLDTGVSRTPTDQCKLLGMKNAADYAATIRQLRSIKARQEERSLARGRITASELSSAVNEYGNLIEDAIQLIPATCAVAAPRPVFRAVYVLACKSGAAAQADEFFKKYVSGAGLQVGDPALALRQWMERRLLEGSQTGAGRNVLIAAVLIRAFNAFLSGKSLKKISYKTDSRFPRFKSVSHIAAAATRAQSGYVPTPPTIRRGGKKLSDLT